jgi:hypothetical protein
MRLSENKYEYAIAFYIIGFLVGFIIVLIAL